MGKYLRYYETDENYQKERENNYFEPWVSLTGYLNGGETETFTVKPYDDELTFFYQYTPDGMYYQWSTMVEKLQITSVDQQEHTIIVSGYTFYYSGDDNNVYWWEGPSIPGDPEGWSYFGVTETEYPTVGDIITLTDISSSQKYAYTTTKNLNVGKTVTIDDETTPILNVENSEPEGLINRVNYNKSEREKTLGEPLTFEITGDGKIFLNHLNWLNDGETFAYKKNDEEWNAYDNDNPYFEIDVVAGDVIKFKADKAYYEYDYEDGDDGLFANSTAQLKIKGNIMSLLNSTTYSTMTEFPNTGSTAQSFPIFPSLFDKCTGLTDASKLLLPATVLKGHCYGGMFSNCSSLTTAPELPATTLADYCYAEMFQYCTSLTTAPELPATTLTEYCYTSMFYNCTSLTIAPELPATALTRYCYQWMFYDCTGLTTAPSILPATTLATHCYEGMFQGCTSLTTAPELPATTLEDGCYIAMFNGCTGLTISPELPATTLATDCYNNMFMECTSLTTAPELPATTLAVRAYRFMFYGCSRLNYIKCLATDISATNCTISWVSGVANSGTFVKDPDMSSWPTGSDGIPTNWTVQDAS